MNWQNPQIDLHIQCIAAFVRTSNLAPSVQLVLRHISHAIVRHDNKGTLTLGLLSDNQSQVKTLTQIHPAKTET